MTGTTPGTGRYRPVTLDQIAAAAAMLITEARAAGLAPPFSLNCHDYGSPTISLYISDRDVPDIRDALQSWADCYRTHLVIRRSNNAPGNLHGDVIFDRNGVRCEITGILTGPGKPSAPDDPQPPGNQAA